MNIIYNDKTDLLYIRLDDRKEELINQKISDDVVLDIGEGDKIVGIEILDASKHLNLDKILPVKFEKAVWKCSIHAASLIKNYLASNRTTAWQVQGFAWRVYKMIDL